MTWEKPSYVEIDMNAEVGAYQDDFGNVPILHYGQYAEGTLTIMTSKREDEPRSLV